MLSSPNFLIYCYLNAHNDASIRNLGNNYFTFADTEIIDATPMFNYRFVDTHEYENPIILDTFKSSRFKTYFLLAKNIFFPKDLLSLLKDIFSIELEFNSESDRKDFYVQLILYVLRTSESENTQKIIEIMETTTYAQDFVSAADVIMEKGVEQGFNQGKAEGIGIGKIEGIDIGIKVISMITAGYEDAQISKLTGLSVEEVKGLREKYKYL